MRASMNCRTCDSPIGLTARNLCRPCETWLLGTPVSRQIAITEVWLDERAEAMRPAVAVPTAWNWPAVVGRVLAVVGIGMLAVEYWRMW